MSNTEAFVGLKYEWNPVSENYSADMDLNLQRIGAMLNLVVQSKTLTAPPSSVANGQAWIVASGASGAWAGKDNNIAAFTNNAWLFIAPIVGLKCFNLADNTTQLWSGSPASWAQDASTAGGGGGGGGVAGVSSIGGETGTITLGSGLEIAGNVLSATSGGGGGGGGGGGSLTITDGSTVLNNVSEVLVKNLGLNSAGGPPAIVQYANFLNGGNVSLGQSVKVGNTLVICTIGQQPNSTLGGLDLAVQSGDFPDGIAFYAGIASSVVSPEVSINCPASIFEISGVTSTATSAVAVAKSNQTYSIPLSDVNANSFVLVATNSVGGGNNNNGAGSTDFTPNETYKIQHPTVGGESVGGLIFGVPDPVTVNSELTFNDPENPYTQAILLEFVGSSSTAPTITPTIPLTINGTTSAPFTSLNVTTTGSSPSASVTGGVLTLGLPVSSGGGGGGGGGGTTDSSGPQIVQIGFAGNGVLQLPKPVTPGNYVFVGISQSTALSSFGALPMLQTVTSGFIQATYGAVATSTISPSETIAGNGIIIEISSSSSVNLSQSTSTQFANTAITQGTFTAADANSLVIGFGMPNSGFTTYSEAMVGPTEFIMGFETIGYQSYPPIISISKNVSIGVNTINITSNGNQPGTCPFLWQEFVAS